VIEVPKLRYCEISYCISDSEEGNENPMNSQIISEFCIKQLTLVRSLNISFGMYWRLAPEFMKFFQLFPNVTNFEFFAECYELEPFNLVKDFKNLRTLDIRCAKVVSDFDLSSLENFPLLTHVYLFQEHARSSGQKRGRHSNFKSLIYSYLS